MRSQKPVPATRPNAPARSPGVRVAEVRASDYSPPRPRGRAQPSRKCSAPGDTLDVPARPCPNRVARVPRQRHSRRAHKAVPNRVARVPRQATLSTRPRGRAQPSRKSSAPGDTLDAPTRPCPTESQEFRARRLSTRPRGRAQPSRKCSAPATLSTRPQGRCPTKSQSLAPARLPTRPSGRAVALEPPHLLEAAVLGVGQNHVVDHFESPSPAPPRPASPSTPRRRRWASGRPTGDCGTALSPPLPRSPRP